MARFNILDAFALWTSLAVCASSAPSPQSLSSGLTILMDNDLQGPSSCKTNSAVILLDSPSTYSKAVAGCEALSETLWSPEDSTSSIQPSLNYLVYEGKATKHSQFWVAAKGSSTRAISAEGKVTTVGNSSSLTLPALCTQSAPLANSSAYDNGTEWRVSVSANNEELVGFRDRTSFRFYGIRYAPQPERFTYPTLYEGNGSTADALSFGSECAQSTSTGSEDCFFLNVWTPYLPQANTATTNHSTDNLKPVMFWIHGGAFTSGTGSDPTFDGGSLASRGDVVVVTINYRLSTFGFLALDDGVTNGNYGIADQITALDWVIANIAAFGGDPSRITIFGQSAGAASVRALMASPLAEGKFAGAIPQSSPGGMEFAKAYSEYYTIPEEMAVAGEAILEEANCTANATTLSEVDCLRQLDTFTLLTLSTTASYVVVDGTYIVTDHLELNTSKKASYSLLMGSMHDDSGALISYPTTSNETAYFDTLGWPTPPASLYPIPDLSNGTDTNATLDLYAMATRYTTDGVFRCIDEATIYSGLQHGLWEKAYYYEFERSYQLDWWPGLSTCQPPITSTHPYGDPAQPYFKCHSGDLYEVFGTILFNGLPFRDEKDLPFEQFAVDTWSAFARTFDPTPDRGYLEARGYEGTAQIIDKTGRWTPSTKGDLTLRALTWPPYQAGFREASQCDGLGLPLTYWE